MTTKRKAKKSRVTFFCTDCGREEAQWSGRCPACGGWDTMREAPTAAAPKAAAHAPAGAGVHEARPITAVATDEAPRFSTGSAEVDRVLGGGLVPGSVVLLGGEPGVGKSTLLLQLAVVMGETDVTAICAEAVRRRVRLLVVDSIQTVADGDTDSAPGSPAQIRAATLLLLTTAKEHNIATVVVGHVTKEGEIAGPKLLEHMVDTVLSFEGDPDRVYRFLRAVKNRFGAVSELGVFVMEQAGLEDVANPSALFIHRASLEHSGACLAPVVVGTRSYVVEVQALVTENTYSFGRRIAQGYDLNRLNLILSVLEKRLHIPLGNFDVTCNVTGGLQVREPALDLAVALAVLSSYRDDVVPAGTAWSGEVGLSGEIRPVYHLDQRAEEARRVGCTRLYHPKGGRAVATDELTTVPVGDLGELLGMLSPRSPGEIT